MRKLSLNAFLRSLRSILLVFMIPIIAVALKTLVVDYSHVSGYSMYPTLDHGQSLVVIKCAYGIRMPRNIYEIPFIGSIAFYLSKDSSVDSILKSAGSFRYIHPSLAEKGDIVAFNIPNNNHFQAVKRCVAIAGDTLPYRSDWLPFNVVPFRGMKIKVDSLSPKQKIYLERNRDFKFNTSDSTFEALDNFVYVKGDNAEVSTDSRQWGPIAMNLIFGKVVYVGIFS